MVKTPMIDFINNINEPTAVVYQRYKKAKRINNIKAIIRSTIISIVTSALTVILLNGLMQ